MRHDRLPRHDPESGDIFAVIETPQGSRNKFDYDPKLNVVLAADALCSSSDLGHEAMLEIFRNRYASQLSIGETPSPCP